MTVLAHRSAPSSTIGPEFRSRAVTEVAIVAASPVVRSGLAAVIDGASGLRAGPCVDSITRLSTAPSGTLIVLDLGGKVSSDESFWRLVPQGARVIVLCLPDSPPQLMAAVKGGVRALITREAETEELITAIRVARRGGLHVSPDLFDAVMSTAMPRGGAGRRELTQREVEALRLIASGLTHGQVSRRMGLTEATVSTYVKRIRHKLNVGNKAELTRRAIELGYVLP